jgi:hypothetical protein
MHHLESRFKLCLLLLWKPNYKIEWGTEDNLIPIEHAERFTQVLREAKFEKVEDATMFEKSNLKNYVHS